MKPMSPLKNILVLLVIGMLTTLATSAFSADTVEQVDAKVTKKADKGLSMDEIEIQSNEMSVDYEKEIAIFTGNVTTVGDQMNMSCERLEIQFNNKTNKIISFTAISITERLVITVKDRKGNNSKATGEKAVYDENKGLLVLTGKPVIQNGNMLLSNMGKATAMIKDGTVNKFEAVSNPALGRVKFKFTKKNDPAKGTE